jgi:hypothetical protein
MLGTIVYADAITNNMLLQTLTGTSHSYQSAMRPIYILACEAALGSRCRRMNKLPLSPRLIRSSSSKNVVSSLPLALSGAVTRTRPPTVQTQNLRQILGQTLHTASHLNKLSQQSRLWG